MHDSEYITAGGQALIAHNLNLPTKWAKSACPPAKPEYLGIDAHPLNTYFPQFIRRFSSQDTAR